MEKRACGEGNVLRPLRKSRAGAIMNMGAPKAIAGKDSASIAAEFDPAALLGRCIRAGNDGAG